MPCWAPSSLACRSLSSGEQSVRGGGALRRFARADHLSEYRRVLGPPQAAGLKPTGPEDVSFFRITRDSSVSYCFAGSSGPIWGDAAEKPSPVSFMDTASALRFVDEVASFRPMLRLFGGETFLHPEWKKVVDQPTSVNKAFASGARIERRLSAAAPARRRIPLELEDVLADDRHQAARPSHGCGWSATGDPSRRSSRGRPPSSSSARR